MNKTKNDNCYGQYKFPGTSAMFYWINWNWILGEHVAKFEYMLYGWSLSKIENSKRAVYKNSAHL
jgi:hypothetical protein